jgi:hypothetical protein
VIIDSIFSSSFPSIRHGLNTWEYARKFDRIGGH